jgi:hypothetical protein
MADPVVEELSKIDLEAAIRRGFESQLRESFDRRLAYLRTQPLTFENLAEQFLYIR